MIMAHLQQFALKQQCEAYVLTRRFCSNCEKFRRIKDFGLLRGFPGTKLGRRDDQSPPPVF
jgi:hypothetical protein